MMSGAGDWIVVHVRAQDVGRARMNVQNQGAEFYCPMIAMRGVKMAGVPMFPGYAFVRHPEGRWAFLRGTFGIGGMVLGMGGGPGKIADSEISRVRQREGKDGLIRLALAPESSSLTHGQQVRIEHGAVSFDAIVEEMSGEDRVWVLMHVLGQWSRAEVDARDVRKK